MSTTPLPVQMNAELQKAISEATNPDAVRAAVLAEAEKQFAVTQAAQQSQADAERKAAEEKTAAAAATEVTMASRTEIIGGREFHFEAANELELERQITNAYKIAFGVQDSSATHQPIIPVPDAAAEAAKSAKEAEDRAIALVELEQKFKRGEISAAQYIEQSGAVDDYLAKKGLSVDDLRASVERTKEQQETDEWAQATQDFMRSPLSSGWPGGDQNIKLIGWQLQELGLLDTNDKVGAIAQAYQSLKNMNMLFVSQTNLNNQNAAAAAAQKAEADRIATETAARTAAQKAEADRIVAEETARRNAPRASGVFGAGTGTFSTPTTATTPVNVSKAQAYEITKEATPAEIMAAWKEAQLAAGRDPNDALREQFAARKY